MFEIGSVASVCIHLGHMYRFLVNQSIGPVLERGQLDRNW